MVTIDEQRAQQLENAEADERIWQGLAGMQTEQAEGNEKLATSAGRAAAKEQAENASRTR
jgi:hypothetical protein